MILAKVREATRLTREGRVWQALSVLRGDPVSHPAADVGRRERRAEQARPAARPAGRSSFDLHAFVGDQGNRHYRLFVPASYAGGPAPLVLMLHGCTQSPEDFSAGTAMNQFAEEAGILVAYPAQIPHANQRKCWNWFHPSHQTRGRGELSIFAGIVDQIGERFAVDRRRIYVCGLSAGGAAAVNAATAYPDLFAAVGVHSGLAAGVAHDVPTALAAMRQGGRPAAGAGGSKPVPTIIFHGDQDRTVNPVNANIVCDQARQGSTLRKSVEIGTVPGGRDYTKSSFVDDRGRPMVEQWLVHGAGHAWSGGKPTGSFTDPLGPDASREMLRFFLLHTS